MIKLVLPFFTGKTIASVKNTVKSIIFLFDAAISKVPLAETYGSKVKRSNQSNSLFMSQCFAPKICFSRLSESAKKRGLMTPIIYFHLKFMEKNEFLFFFKSILKFLLLCLQGKIEWWKTMGQFYKSFRRLAQSF